VNKHEYIRLHKLSHNHRIWKETRW